MNTIFSQHKNVELVSTFSDLANFYFNGHKNAVCWHRELKGDFKEIVLKLKLRGNITEVSIDELSSLNLSSDGQVARQIILNDLRLLHDFGASPSLNLLKNYERDDELDFISTDVYSFHVDRSPISTDTFLCTYYGPASDILANEDATQKILVPEIREKLRELYDGPKKDFDLFLKEYYFDLHYQPNFDAKPLNLESGHLWKLAVDHPNQKVLPCIHRAPVENNDDYRLLLIC